MNRLKKYLKVFGVILFIIFEEVLWNRVGLPIYNKIKSLKIMIRFKDYITNIEHKYLLLLIFIQPVGIDIILSLLFTQAMASGMLFAAIGIYVLKALASVLMVIIFNTGKKQLVKFWIIKYSYGVILRFKRSSTFRDVKNYTAKVRDEFIKFKENYIDGNGEFSDELSKIYKSIKRI